MNMHTYRVNHPLPSYVELSPRVDVKQFFESTYPGVSYVRVHQKEVELYRWDDLSEEAKDRALEDHYKDEFPWSREYEKSLQHFCEALYAKDSIKDWNVGYPGTSISTQFLQQNLRGLTLKQARTLKLSDGFCAGEKLEEVFLREFENTGDAAYAFRQAAEAWLRDFEHDIEHYYSKEYLAEEIHVWYTAEGRWYDCD